MYRSANRDRLLKTLSRISGVRFGKELLEKKRDGLMRSMEEERRAFFELRDRLRQMCSRIGTVCGLIKAYEGSPAMEALRLRHRTVSLLVRKESVMGRRYRTFIPERPEKETEDDPAMDLAPDSFFLEDLDNLISQADEVLWLYVTLRSRIQALEKDLIKINLKINTLEHNFLPSLTEERKRILEALSERERHEAFLIKKMAKKKKER